MSLGCCEVKKETLAGGNDKDKDSKEARMVIDESNPARLADLYLMNAVQPGEWPKAGDVRAVLQRRGDDRAICRASAKAAEHIVSHDRGLDALVEREVLQQLAEVWQRHATDTVLAVSVQNIAARFWERAATDLQWFMIPSTVAAGRALAKTDRQEWHVEVHRVAVRLHERGCSQAALDAYRLAISSLEGSLGQAHPSTIQAQNNLAVLLEECQQYDEAEQLHQNVLQKCEKTLGTDHQDTLSSRFNLAVLRAKQGKLEEAESLYRQVAERREKTLGPQDTNTLRAKSNYAYHLQKLGKVKEAEALFKAVVDQRHVALGRAHPETLRSRCHLALVLAKQDDSQLREAEAQLREVASQRENKFGREHIDTLTTLSHLVVVLERTRPEEAARLQEEVWTRLDAALPIERRRTRAEQGSFISGLESSQVIAMLRQVAERREKSLGADHPDTLRARSELASQLALKGEADQEAQWRLEALQIRQEIAERSTAALGHGHVTTLAARCALASSLRRQNAKGAEEAEQIHRSVLTRMAEALSACAVNNGAPNDIGFGSPTRLAVIVRD